MDTSVLRIIDAFEGVRTAVIGDAMLDRYYRGSSSNLCREAPVPVVGVSEELRAPGGAANTAVNARALGSRAQLISVVGADEEGEHLLRLLASSGVDVTGVVLQPELRTLSKNRVIADNQMLVRFDLGKTVRMTRESEDALADRITRVFIDSHAVVVSDYDSGIFTPRIVSLIAELQASHPRVLVVDAKNLDRYCSMGITAIKPNYTEAVRLLDLERVDHSEARVEQLVREGPAILDKLDVRIAAVTLDVSGALIFERGRQTLRLQAANCAPGQGGATGAGDTFAAALALGLAVKATVPEAAELASAAAALVVEGEGTCACSARQLRGYAVASSKEVAREHLPLLADYHAGRKRRMVFTNGCFDILHRGHIAHLRASRLLGDVLIVGMNSDESIRRLKGPERPVNTLRDRMKVLAALDCVDHVVGFEEDTACEIVRTLSPDVFTKGGDYSKEAAPEAAIAAALGGEVHILPYLEDYSTTSLIEHMRRPRLRVLDGFAGAGETESRRIAELGE